MKVVAVVMVLVLVLVPWMNRVSLGGLGGAEAASHFGFGTFENVGEYFRE